MYAYIPLSAASRLAAPAGYPVRIPVYVQGYLPDMLDSNGQGIPNVLEMESDSGGFTQDQMFDIEQLGGQYFESAEVYSGWMHSLLNV
ncbi:MAG: hypothetical protein KF690_11250 [Bacteroidetes bacterium]|nr:hypothetical protein [Bacteroidota bacterium]